MLYITVPKTGFPTGVENMGGCTPLKNTREGFHLLVKLPAISLQTCKFTKHELLHTYFNLLEKCSSLLLFILTHSCLSYTILVTD